MRSRVCRIGIRWARLFRSLFRFDLSFSTPTKNFPDEKNALFQGQPKLLSRNSSITNQSLLEMFQFISGTSFFHLNPLLLLPQLFKVCPVIRRCERLRRQGFPYVLQSKTKRLRVYWRSDFQIARFYFE